MSRDVPSGWFEAPLGEIFNVNWGNTSITKASYSAAGYPAFSASGPDGLLPTYQHDEDAIIVSAIGANSGRCFFATGKWTAIKNTMTVQAKESRGHLPYAFQLLNNPSRWPIEGGAQPFIGLKKARAGSHVWPPLPEQRRIAEILSSVDEAIQATEAVIEQTRSVKDNVLARLLSKGIGPQRFVGSNSDSVSSRWAVKPLGSVVALSGGTGFPIRYQGNTDLPFPFIKVSDMNLPGNEKHIRTWNNTIDAGIAKALRGRPFPAGAVIFPKVGAALLTNKRRLLERPTFVDNNVMVATPGPEIRSEYLYHWLCQIDFAKHVQSGAIPSINQQQVGALPISLPPLEQQEAIGSILFEFDETLVALEESAHELRLAKSGLMSDLFTGRKRVINTMALAAE